MFQIIPSYAERTLGLPYPVTLIDSVEEEIDDSTGGSIGISVPDLEKLVAAVAIARALDPVRLDGREVRFMRQAIGMNATSFAEALELQKETFSRWENNKQILGGWADKQVRLFAIVKLGLIVPCLSVNVTDVVDLRLQERQRDYDPDLVFKRVSIFEGDCAGNEEWDTCTDLAA